MATISLRNINPVRFDYNVYMMSNLGIGTTSPATDLHIKSADPVIRLEDSSPDGVYGSIDGAGGSLVLSADQGAGAASSNIQFKVDNAEAMRVIAGGNVGIGTTSPSNKLDVAGDIGIDEYIRHNGDTNTYMRFQTDSWLVRTNGDDRIYVASDGEVGIGTTSPGEKLHLVTGGNTRIRIDSGDSSASSVDLYDNGSLGARINCDSSKNLELMAGGRTSADMIINTTTGYVGINTTAPKRSLHIHTTTAASCFLQVTNSTTGSGSDGDGFQFGVGSSGGAQIIQRENLALTISTNNTERLIISADGKVGIGTASPTYTLDVAGNIGVDEYIYHNGDTNTSMRFQPDSWLLSTNGGDRIYVASDGLVGIGTNSPAYMLDVNGTIRCNTIMLADGTSFSSVGQVGMKAIAVNIGNGNTNVVGRAQSIINASYGGIQNGMVVVYYYWSYTYGCGNGTCGATVHHRDFYQVVNGVWTIHFRV